MEQRNLKFMLRCQHNSHIILYYRGKLISQLIKVAAARGVHQHSLNWILHKKNGIRKRGRRKGKK